MHGRHGPAKLTALPFSMVAAGGLIGRPTNADRLVQIQHVIIQVDAQARRVLGQLFKANRLPGQAGCYRLASGPVIGICSQPIEPRLGVAVLSPDNFGWQQVSPELGHPR